jgi:uncharacterized protein involved in outer membrane biogenesis
MLGSEFFRRHERTKWTLFGVLGLVAVIVIFLSFFNWNSLRPALAARITAATGRPTSIDGDLKVHLWSWNPSAEVNGLALQNPGWADRRMMFTARRITVSISLGRLLRGQIVLPQVELRAPEINLERDAKGRASWELGSKAGTPNHDTRPAKLPTIRRLLIEDGKLHVVDQRRKLTFSGSLVAADQSGRNDAAAFKIRSRGSLNAKPFSLDADGGPLLAIEPGKPYSFDAHLQASDIDLKTHITARKPFDMGALDIGFVLTGKDLADVFYLTGLALPNTPPYRLAADVHVDGNDIRVDDLQGRLGGSDLAGTADVQTAGARPKLTAKLTSKHLNMADLEPTLGHPTPTTSSLSAPAAAGVAPGSGAAKPDSAGGKPDSQAAAVDGREELLLPDADLQVSRVRGMDADVTYRASSVTMPKVPMQQVSFHLLLDDGLLTLDPLSFGLDSGTLSGKVQIDARQDMPVTHIDMRIAGVDLSQFKSAAMKQAPLEGTLQGRFVFHGPGTSVHKFAAASDGALSVVIPHGQISDVLAELTGINVLKGLGLLLAKDQSQTEIRCGIMDFHDQQGSLKSTTVFIDTTNVLITGRGDINLGSEDLNLALQGDAKKVRLVRLRTPIMLEGTMLHPGIGVNAGKLAQQAGAAAALGVLLTPVAAALAFIDPGLAKDKDCSTVLAQADAGAKELTGRN